MDNASNEEKTKATEAVVARQLAPISGALSTDTKPLFSIYNGWLLAHIIVVLVTAVIVLIDVEVALWFLTGYLAVVAMARAVFPSSWVGVLAVRRRWIDTSFFLTLSGLFFLLVSTANLG